MTNDLKYKVGYRQPPLHTRFQKGKSGNPRGRAKDKLNIASALRRALVEKVVIKEGAVTRRMRKISVRFENVSNHLSQLTTVVSSITTSRASKFSAVSSSSTLRKLTKAKGRMRQASFISLGKRLPQRDAMKFFYPTPVPFDPRPAQLSWHQSPGAAGGWTNSSLTSAQMQKP
jgi:hypothetical protein